MPTKELLTLNNNRLGVCSFSNLRNGEREYHARFISSGPDVALVLSHHSVKCYAGGALCEELNAFVEYAGQLNIPRVLEKLDVQAGVTTILVGRWHLPERGRGFFEPHLRHDIGEDASVRSRAYDLVLFEGDDEQSAMTISLDGAVDPDFIECLQEWTDELTVDFDDALTPFGLPRADGIAWVPSDRQAQPIFTFSNFSSGLERDLLVETLSLNPKKFRNVFSTAAQKIRFGDLMQHAGSQRYFFQIRQGGPTEKPFRPNLVRFDPTKTHRQDVELILNHGIEAEAYAYASEWIDQGRGVFARILV